MASLNLGTEWHTFTAKKVDELIELGRVGNYALAYQKEGSSDYYVSYVGRSDSCLNSRLKSHDYLGHAKCNFFKFMYASSRHAAYEKECNNFHDFPGLLNKIHPDQPEKLKLKCPKGECG